MKYVDAYDVWHVVLNLRPVLEALKNIWILYIVLVLMVYIAKTMDIRFHF